jgi:hypothetical protein
VALEQEAAELQKALAHIDFLERPHNRVSFLVLELKYLQIRMDGDRNHQRPHVHVAYGNNHHAATYAIDNSERLVGTLPTQHDCTVREWVTTYKPQLLDLWTLTQAGKPTKAVISELQSSGRAVP